MKKVAKKKKAVKKEVKKTPGVAVITINVKENDALSGAEGKVIAKIEGSVNFHMAVLESLERLKQDIKMKVAKDLISAAFTGKKKPK